MTLNTLLLSQSVTEWKGITGKGSLCIVDGVPTLKCFEVIFGNILFSASAIVVVILFMMLLFGAFLYLTSGGNPERVKKAQSALKFALFGFVLFLSAFLIIRIIDFLFLGGKGTLFRLNLGD